MCVCAVAVLLTVAVVLMTTQAFRVGVLRPVVDVGVDEAALLFEVRVACWIAGVRCDGGVVVVHPLGEVVGELETGRVGCCVLKVDDDQLLVLVGRLEERRGAF